MGGGEEKADTLTIHRLKIGEHEEEEEEGQLFEGTPLKHRENESRAIKPD